MNIIDAVGNTAGIAVGVVSSLIYGEEDHNEKAKKNNPYGSFATTRQNVHAKWYSDGKDYFFAVSEALLSATKEIFIEDWWLSPELVS
jgi:hypothetical protein